MDVRLVTEENVFAACDSLVAIGRKPSYRSIIEELGGGSPNDIKPFFTAWKLRNESVADMAEPEPPALPRLQEEAPTLVPVIETLAASLLRTMAASTEAMKAEYEGKIATVQEGVEARLFQVRHEAEQAIKAAREEAAAEVAALHEAEAVLIDERDGLAVRVGELELERGGLEADLKAERENVARLESELANERGVSTGLGQQLAAAERAVKDLAAELKTQKELAIRLESEKATMLALVDGLRGDMVRERERNEALHARVEELVAELARARSAA